SRDWDSAAARRRRRLEGDERSLHGAVSREVGRADELLRRRGLDGQRRLPRRARLVELPRRAGAAHRDALGRHDRGAAMKRSWVALILGCVTATAASAQDSRTVVEPKRPASCAVLNAELSPVADTTLAESDETKLDTRRIQAAIDHCGPGRAVVLR